MGIPWSTNNNRRRNTYRQNPPPPPLPPQYYPTEPISLPPPPPPPPPPNNYSIPTTSTTTTPYPPPHNPYPAPPPLPPPLPPPYFHSYYSSHPYNHIRYNYPQQPHIYASQGNGWWPTARPNALVGPSLPQTVEPAPYVEHQNAKKVRNDVNVHKDTLKVEVDEENPDHHLVSFVFDAMLDGSITIFYFAKEESHCRFVPLFPEAYLPTRIPFQKGLGQKFCQPSGTGIDLGFFELDDLSKPSPEDVFPLVIVAETHLPGHASGNHDDKNTSNHMQITQAVLEKKDGNSFQVKVIKQILWVDGVRYELHEIYGMGGSSAEDFDDSDPGKECVICMTEPKDTAVLPCRHMCLCGECAKALRLQSNKCPICRQPIEKLIEIKINSNDQ